MSDSKSTVPNEQDPRESDAWEEAKQAIDEQDLLMRQTFALEAIAQELRRIGHSESKPTENRSEESESQYKCNSCLQVYAEHELESHAKSCKNWSPAIGPVTDEYSKL